MFTRYVSAIAMKCQSRACAGSHDCIHLWQLATMHTCFRSRSANAVHGCGSISQGCELVLRALLAGEALCTSPLSLPLAQTSETA